MVLPEINPETGHSIGCTCYGCNKWIPTPNLDKFSRRYRWDDNET